MTTSALKLRGICKSFDGFKALSDADFDVQWGEFHALLGENGAGKSSLMNIAAGLYQPDSGEIRVDGQPARLAGPRDAAALRIGMVHQHFKLVKPFTVAENILLGHPLARSAGSHLGRLRRMEGLIREKARALGFEIDPTQRVERLSIAEQQRVEILKVLLAGAQVLILDEPTAVLTDAESTRLLSTIQALAASGSAVVLVTHKMSDVTTYASRVTVMRGGRTVKTVDPRRVTAAELVQLTVGDSVAAPKRERATPGEALLTVRGLCSAGSGPKALNGVDLRLHAGQIYGLAGVGGNGQGELAAALCGLDDATHDAPDGEMTLHGGVDLRRTPPAGRRSLNFAAIPADRYGLALAGALSVAENFGIGQVHDGRYGPFWRLDRGRMREQAQAAVAAFDVQGVRHPDQKAALLSGGNAQKLVLAREFGRAPRIVVAHSPSRGLDVRASADVHARLLAARRDGAAVLLISEDLDEVLALADRIGVMNRGRIVAEFEQPADRQAVGRAMVDHG